VSSFVPYSCLLFKICAAYAEVELLEFIYLTPIALPDSPTYTLLYVLHFSSYMPLGSSCVCLVLLYCVGCTESYFQICLPKRFDIFLTNGLKYVNVTHLFRRAVVTCCCCRR